ncbi:MAG: DUF2784 domain-containing protein [Spirochaetia bacterium]|jgi:hypothetical protein|nr:DUF2784 domain-containing protein [Spirochaetia bacterium]
MYRIAADFILIIHSLIVLFIIGGFLFISAGIIMKKRFVSRFCFRFIHLLAIFYIIAETWIGKLCPLTDLESFFREKSGMESYSGTFVSHWLGKLIYYDFDLAVFQSAYTIFGILVLLQWVIKPPDFPFKRGRINK